MLSGRALDAGLFHAVFIAGFLVECFGVFMTSLSDQYYQLFLAQGVLVGIGCGMQFCPVMGLVTTYFSKHRAVAVGIVASGSATGGLVYPTIVRQLLPKIGFGWTVRVMGFMMLAIGCFTASLLRTRLPPRRSGPIVDFECFRELPYSLYVLGTFLCIWGQFFAFYYVSLIREVGRRVCS